MSRALLSAHLHLHGSRGSWAACCMAVGLLFGAIAAHAQTQDDAYLRTCAACHGPQLRGGETGPALIGSTFAQHWGAVPAVGLDEFTRRTMPPTAPGSLSDDDYVAALTRIRRANGWVVPPAAAGVAGATRIAATAEWLNNRGDLGA